MHWRFESLKRKGASIRKLELISDQALRRRVNNQLIGFGQRLQARGQIRSFAEHRPFSGDVLSDELSHDDGTSRDSDSCRDCRFLLGIFIKQAAWLECCQALDPTDQVALLDHFQLHCFEVGHLNSGKGPVEVAGGTAEDVLCFVLGRDRCGL